MNEKKQSTVKQSAGHPRNGRGHDGIRGTDYHLCSIRYSLIRHVFSGQNVMNLLRSMSKYLLIGVGQSYVLITGNIDLSIGSMVGMSAMMSATLMTMGVQPDHGHGGSAAVLPGLRRDQRHSGGKVQAPALHRHPGHHVRGPRRCLHGQQQPQHRRHRHRHRQGSGRQLPEPVSTTARPSAFTIPSGSP